MSSSMETELLKSGIEGEHTTWKERDRAKWEQKREGCKMAKAEFEYTGSFSRTAEGLKFEKNERAFCIGTEQFCDYDICPFVYWMRP